MLVTLDKLTTVKMFNYILHHWNENIKTLEKQIEKGLYGDQETLALSRELEWIKEIDDLFRVGHFKPLAVCVRIIGHYKSSIVPRAAIELKLTTAPPPLRAILLTTCDATTNGAVRFASIT